MSYCLSRIHDSYLPVCQIACPSTALVFFFRHSLKFNASLERLKGEKKKLFISNLTSACIIERVRQATVLLEVIMKNLSGLLSFLFSHFHHPWSHIASPLFIEHRYCARISVPTASLFFLNAYWATSMRSSCLQGDSCCHRHWL